MCLLIQLKAAEGRLRRLYGSILEAADVLQLNEMN